MPEDRLARQRAQVLFLARRGFTAADLADLFRVSETDIKQRFSAEIARAKKQPIKTGEWPTADKLAELRRENRKLRDAEDARVKAALAGVPVCIPDAEIKRIGEQAQSRMAAALDKIAERQVKTATDPMADNADAHRAGAWIFDRVKGPVTQKIKHEISVHVDLSTATEEELAIIEQAQAIIDRLGAKAAG